MNTRRISSCWPEKFNCPLTKKGQGQVKIQAKKLKKKKIDLIFSSDLLRTRQTAGIVSKKLGIKPKYDKRLREFDVGFLNGRPLEELNNFFGREENRFKKRPSGGENYSDIKKRVRDFLKDIDQRYSGKTVLIISHQAPLMIFGAVVKGFSNQEILKNKEKLKLKVGELRELK